jgi:hypothetical protein
MGKRSRRPGSSFGGFRRLILGFPDERLLAVATGSAVTLGCRHDHLPSGMLAKCRLGYWIGAEARFVNGLPTAKEERTRALCTGHLPTIGPHVLCFDVEGICAERIALFWASVDGPHPPIVCWTSTSNVVCRAGTKFPRNFRWLGIFFAANLARARRSH